MMHSVGKQLLEIRIGVMRSRSAAAKAHVEDVYVPGVRQEAAPAQRVEQRTELEECIQRIESPQLGIRSDAPAADAVIGGSGDQSGDACAVPAGRVEIEGVGGVHSVSPCEFRVRDGVERVEVERGTLLDIVLQVGMTDFHARIHHRHLHSGTGRAVVEGAVHLQVFPGNAAGLGVTGLPGVVQVPLLGQQRVGYAGGPAPARFYANLLDALQAVQGESGHGSRQDFGLLRVGRYVLNQHLEIVRLAAFQRAGKKREIGAERRSLAVDGRDICAGLALDYASPVVRVCRGFVRNQRNKLCAK